jgi:hypothetical protein
VTTRSGVREDASEGELQDALNLAVTVFGRRAVITALRHVHLFDHLRKRARDQLTIAETAHAAGVEFLLHFKVSPRPKAGDRVVISTEIPPEQLTLPPTVS